MIKISGFTARTADIFEASADKFSAPGISQSPERFFFHAGLSMGRDGAGLNLRFNFSRKARCAFRRGVGSRAVGFCISIMEHVDLGSDLRNWRTQISSLKFAHVFRDDRAARPHYRFAHSAEGAR